MLLVTDPPMRFCTNFFIYVHTCTHPHRQKATQTDACVHTRIHIHTHT